MEEGATTRCGLQSQGLLQTGVLAASSSKTSNLSDAYHISIQSCCWEQIQEETQREMKDATGCYRYE